MTYDGPWFPMVLSDKCDGCAKAGKPRCVEFCPNGVFDFKEGKAIVAFPAKCGGEGNVFHCSACAPLCQKKAIVFPQGNISRQLVKDENKGVIRKTICRVCGKHYWTNREIDICYDCEARK